MHIISFACAADMSGNDIVDPVDYDFKVHKAQDPKDGQFKGYAKCPHHDDAKKGHGSLGILLSQTYPAEATREAFKRLMPRAVFHKQIHRHLL